MRHVRPSLRKDLCSPLADVQRRAEAMVGTIMADALAQLEVLSPHPAADSAFEGPMRRMLGESVGSGAPAID
jgi:hypothetical protein